MAEWVMKMAFPIIKIVTDPKTGDQRMTVPELHDVDDPSLALNTELFTKEVRERVYAETVAGEMNYRPHFRDAVAAVLDRFVEGIEPARIIAYSINFTGEDTFHGLDKMLVMRVHTFYIRYLRLRRDIKRVLGTESRVALAAEIVDHDGAELHTVGKLQQAVALRPGHFIPPQAPSDQLSYITAAIPNPEAPAGRQHSRSALGLLASHNTLQTLALLLPQAMPSMTEGRSIEDIALAVRDYLADPARDALDGITARASDGPDFVPTPDGPFMPASGPLSHIGPLQKALVAATTELVALHPEVLQTAREVFNPTAELLAQLTPKGRQLLTMNHDLSDVFAYEGRDEMEIQPFFSIPMAALHPALWAHDPMRSAIALNRSGVRPDPDARDDDDAPRRPSTCSSARDCRELDLDMWYATIATRLARAKEDGLVTIQVLSPQAAQVEVARLHSNAPTRPTSGEPSDPIGQAVTSIDTILGTIVQEWTAALPYAGTLSNTQTRLLGVRAGLLKVRRRTAREAWDAAVAASRDYIVSRVTDRLRRMVDTLPPRPPGWDRRTADMEVELDRHPDTYHVASERIIAVNPARTRAESSIAVAIDGRGHVMDVATFGYMHTFQGRGKSATGDGLALGDLATFVKFVDRTHPSVIAIDAGSYFGAAMKRMIDDPRASFRDCSLPWPDDMPEHIHSDPAIESPPLVTLVDPRVAAVLAATVTDTDTFLNPETLRGTPRAVLTHIMALTVQDPLGMASIAVARPGAGECLPLHSLQDRVPSGLLLQAMADELSIIVASVGIDYARMVTYPPHAATLQFVPGLGPSKARVALTRALQSDASVDTRSDVTNILGLGTTVGINSALFIFVRSAAMAVKIRSKHTSTVYLDSTRVEPTSEAYTAALAVVCAQTSLLEESSFLNAEGHLVPDRALFKTICKTIVDKEFRAELARLFTRHETDYQQFSVELIAIAQRASKFAGTPVTSVFAANVLRECLIPFDDRRPEWTSPERIIVGGRSLREALMPLRSEDVQTNPAVIATAVPKWAPREYTDAFGRFRNVTARDAMLDLYSKPRGSYVVRPSTHDGLTNDERRGARCPAKHYLAITIKLEGGAGDDQIGGPGPSQVVRHIRVEELDKAGGPTVMGSRLRIDDDTEPGGVDAPVFEGIDDLCENYIRPLINNCSAVWSHTQYWDAAEAGALAADTAAPDLADDQKLREIIKQKFYGDVFYVGRPKTTPYLIMASRGYVGCYEIWAGFVQQRDSYAGINGVENIIVKRARFAPTHTGYTFLNRTFTHFTGENSVMAAFKAEMRRSLQAQAQPRPVVPAGPAFGVKAGADLGAFRAKPQALTTARDVYTPPAEDDVGYVHPSRR